MNSSTYSWSTMGVLPFRPGHHVRLPAKPASDADGPQASNADGSAITLVQVRFLKLTLDGIENIKLQHDVLLPFVYQA